jgi:hypothetical protein
MVALASIAIHSCALTPKKAFLLLLLLLLLFREL